MLSWYLRHTTGSHSRASQTRPENLSVFDPLGWAVEKKDARVKPERDSARKPYSLSTRSLSALAILIAGALIAAQALYIPAKAQVAQVLMSNAWERQLSTGDPARPWPWADFSPAAKLFFPAQHRDVIALTDAAGESLAFGPTLMAASAKPGERGVAVFAAHRDTHFAFLGDVKPGDEIAVQIKDGTRTFRVTGSEVVRWDASGIHAHDGGKARLALVTCWPLDAKVHGPMRYVVWAELVPTAPPLIGGLTSERPAASTPSPA